MRLDDLQFFDPRAPIVFGANRLPHWQQSGGTCFVTFRLGDSVPKPLLDRWGSERDAWLRLHPLPWTSAHEREYDERFAGAMEVWLDAGHGACVLRRADCAAVVAEALRHFAGERYEPISWVVMPNHVHALFAFRADHTLESILHSWKLFSARRINARLGRKGPLWQRDYFDRLIRDHSHLARCVRYIRHNPEKAGLRPGEYLLFESELAKQIV